MHQRAPFSRHTPTLKPLTSEEGLQRLDKALSGRWKCRLTAVTPLCIRTSFEQQRRSNSKPLFIPATSIRGMIRNVAQMLGAGCGRTYSPEWELPRNLAPCSTASACVVCRTFGFVQGQESWQSKVRFQDATAQGRAEWITLDTDDRSGWGGGEPEEKAGWALFTHQDEDLAMGKTPCLRESTEFDFEVDYLNLDAEELAVLRLALTLEGGGKKLVHKIGFAKSLGLGSCLIRIANDAPLKDPLRQAEVTRQTARYLGMPGFQAIERWREAK